MTQELLLQLTDRSCDTLTKLLAIFKFIKSSNKNDFGRIKLLIEFFSKNKEQFRGVCDEIAILFLNLKISIDITSIAMLSRNGFVYEIKDRFYNKFLPNPPKNGELKHIFATIFQKKDDFEWVCGIDDELWLEFFSQVFNNSIHIDKLKEHLF